MFGTEANKELLIDFLNQLITDQGTITDLQFLSAEQLGRDHLQNLVFCEKARSASIFVAVCVSAR
ncbi:MAG: Rpn family recombination-promoting nuclease/putative transposase [Dysgonamonadaceae bacterium]|nr:Rpn family recombination-promoting nuclease/putative transposase [Dysgonamonadaceae bacterium]